MRLEFSILWFENQPQDVRTQIEEISDYVREVGFVPKIQIEESAARLAYLATQQQLYDDFDLVVVDYDLGDPSMNGDHVAQQVRRSFGFTDILFYSGHKTVDLRRLVHDRHIDGVYCLERRQLAERLCLHIDQVVKRLSRLEAMRGLAMGTVGKCDDELRLLLTEAYASKPNEQEAMEETIDKLVADSSKLQARRYEECRTFADRLDSRAVTSFHLQKLALALLKGDKNCVDQRKILARYDNEVLKPRNTLGHATESRGDRGWQVTSRGTPAIQTNDFAMLRKNLTLHLENICTLRPRLSGKGDEKSG
ncbi:MULTISPECIES: hypothetical protein [Bradyrhizobium]|jgi:CheY-like chemotaxis protein|uniref:hypothetical protein n=1 Tax=Bradyrhizobium TaxID=374 RepID=UPI000463DF99|nr:MULTISPECIES: hypothetical protein [Bradyrhizobium]KIU47551.1 hypothetical protein QU41_16955 [Bradyrhizobium elkanii]OCX28774.1 hypothetical protein QU42_22270 [Bradyrhizobium sp. UASWS1016]